MLTVDRLSANELIASRKDEILQRLKKTRNDIGIPVVWYRKALKELKKLFKVGNSASVSVKRDSNVTRLIIRVNKDTEAVKKLIKAVSELTWTNPIKYFDDFDSAFDMGGDVSMKVVYGNADLTDKDTIIKSLKPTRAHEFCEDEYREGLRNLRNVLHVGDDIRVSVRTDYWPATTLHIKIKEETDAVREFIEAVKELGWENPENDVLHDKKAGGNVSVKIEYLKVLGNKRVEYYGGERYE